MKQDEQKEGTLIWVNDIFILQTHKGFGGLTRIASLQAFRQWIPQLEHLRLLSAERQAHYGQAC